MVMRIVRASFISSSYSLHTAQHLYKIFFAFNNNEKNATAATKLHIEEILICNENEKYRNFFDAVYRYSYEVNEIELLCTE